MSISTEADRRPLRTTTERSHGEKGERTDHPDGRKDAEWGASPLASHFGSIESAHGTRPAQNGR